MKLTWNVFYENVNKREIEEYNVFRHGRFYHDMWLCLRDSRDKDEFKTELRRDIIYYYGYKCEWEVIVTDWPTHIAKEELERLNKENHGYRYSVNLDVERKVDVAQQIMMNYDHFIDYIWQNRDEVLKNEENE